jgi:16S rRNA (cytosine967-C5)-methyltransferase
VSPRAANQIRTFYALYNELHGAMRADKNFPAKLQQRLARERRFGSRDRRLYRELLYTVVRYLPWFEAAHARSLEEAARLAVWLASDSPALFELKDALTTQLPPTPRCIAEKAAVLGDVASVPLVPEWLRAHCPQACDSPEIDVLHTRAPLWLRLQTDTPDAVFAEFSERGWRWQTSLVLPNAVRMLDDVDVTPTQAFARGAIEVQDLGSQLILERAEPAKGEHWLDACAGAGGKTLQLARLLGPIGKVTAHDIRPTALAELRLRVERAGLNNIDVADALAPDRQFDGVLVDVPCSGSGTWRRAPHLKWSTNPKDIAVTALLQSRLLARFAQQVRPGGKLIYATCSLSRVENEDVAASFLATHANFHVAFNACTLLPSQHDTDGFFVAGFFKRLSCTLEEEGA